VSQCDKLSKALKDGVVVSHLNCKKYGMKVCLSQRFGDLQKDRKKYGLENYYLYKKEFKTGIKRTEYFAREK